MLLDEIASGVILAGLVPDSAADLIAVHWIGEGGREQPSNQRNLAEPL